MPNETDGIIKRFEQRTIRSLWDEERQEWYFSIVDVVGALTDSPDYHCFRSGTGVFCNWSKGRDTVVLY